MRNVLVAIATSSQERYETSKLLADQEYNQALQKWNATWKSYGSAEYLHTLFEKQVERTPGAIAVANEQRALTYRDLNVQANQVARHLQSLGVGPNILVGVFMERSLELFVATLAILKAGGAYVPLDPTYPQDRITYMLQDAQISIILTQTHLQHQLSPSGITVLPVDAQEMMAEAMSDGQSENLKYFHLSTRPGVPDLYFWFYWKPKGSWRLPSERDKSAELVSGCIPSHGSG